MSTMEQTTHNKQCEESDEEIGTENHDANDDNQNLIGWDHGIENEEDHDDPVAEGDEPYMPKLEPSMKKASSTKFLSLCKGLETVCRMIRKRERSMSEVDKLKTILKPEYLQWLAEPSAPGEPPESAFPVLRLLLPEKDGSRSFQMKEKILGKMYADAFGYSPNTSKYQKLMNFTNPNVVSPDEGVGDFSLVVYSIVSKERKQTRDAKGLSIGDLNLYLDELSSLPRKAREAKSNHDWRSGDSTTKTKSSSPSSTVRKPPNLNALRADWLRKIHADRPGRPGLSPVEHKWLVRILLNRLHIGVGWKTLLKWYNPFAAMLWSAHNSLKGICDKLCDPEFTDPTSHMAPHNDDNDRLETKGLESYMPRSLASPQFGLPFSPMLSERTGFDRLLNDISRRHRSFMKADGAVHFPNATSSLSFHHPTFSVEPKLDGERLLVHISRSGIVKMHTRRGNWYSDLYAPTLGPALRKSVEQWNFDIILDGEVLAWDSQRQETVPFGNNRTIARLRQQWMEHKHLIDARDQCIHDADSTVKSMNVSNTWDTKDSPYELAGKECWLQFIAFDVLYVDGPGAEEFLNDTVASYVSPRPSCGSIIRLDGFERKKILCKLIQPQADEVEIVKTWVIRPTGKISLGTEYFDVKNPTMECGYPEYAVDSLNWTLSGTMNDLTSVDNARRGNLSDSQISQSRARAVQQIYDITVENQRMEGLVFKDLSSPYFLGEESKSMRYWHKFKPDYFNGSVASDIDVVIVGASFASGLRFSGKPSSFLCACVDSEDDNHFFTLCKVNMGSMDNETANNFLESTGFVADGQTSAVERNVWFRESDHGKTLPDFLSKRSYQSKSIDGSWRFEKKDYPDLWIHPENSKILTLNAGEIVVSESFSAGLTLRFPRIVKIRNDADDKPRCEIESDITLWRIFKDVNESRAAMGTESVNDISSFVDQKLMRPCRFLTEEQFRESDTRPRRQKNTVVGQGVIVPRVAEKESSLLSGMTFHVFEGAYNLQDDPIAADVAKLEEWYVDGAEVRSSASVQRFILKHGGTVVLSPDGETTYVLGGTRLDPRVMAYTRSIEAARKMHKSIKLKSKKSAGNAAIAVKPGCLRWHSVYSFVYNHIKAHRLAGIDVLLETSKTKALVPTALDYLSRPHSKLECVEGVDSALLRANISSTLQLRRILEIVSQTETARINRRQNVRLMEEIKFLIPACERSNFKTSLQTLHDNTIQSDKIEVSIVLYPHIFSDLGGEQPNPDSDADSLRKPVANDPTISEIEAAVPLARVMGAEITTNLHIHVTHVLCDISADTVLFHKNIPDELFGNRSRGNTLIDRLGSIVERSGKEVRLVSPSWLRKRKRS